MCTPFETRYLEYQSCSMHKSLGRCRYATRHRYPNSSWRRLDRLAWTTYCPSLGESQRGTPKWRACLNGTTPQMFRIGYANYFWMFFVLWVNKSLGFPSVVGRAWACHACMPSSFPLKPVTTCAKFDEGRVVHFLLIPWVGFWWGMGSDLFDPTGSPDWTVRFRPRRGWPINCTSSFLAVSRHDCY